ncbi:helix-turn-helix domain-containing protein [Rhodococcus qingshengii]|uniref:helix-turn-helix domain-containing protein n=1 Tax=Rhodococcus qingshengii TaxID=334542 RepID=UPI001E2E8C0B|nr:helix-turn-helix transcriptional regulator [Rhodococcus qingshengii]MCD2134732.1 helix-turn-helix domain-containing protein [Rhodococcus qingshengii]
MISDIDDDATLVIHAQVDSWTLNLISSYFMTTSSEGWPEALTKSVVAQISSYRKKRGLSYQQLADKCTELGYPTLRTTLANLEAHKRKSLTLHELIILAAALDVPPVELLFPGIPDGEVQILPNKKQNAWEALQWFTGETPTLDPADAPEPTDPNYHIALIRDMKYGVRQNQLVTDEELENIGSGDDAQNANLALRMLLNAIAPELLKNANLDVLRNAGFIVNEPKDDTDV